MNSTNIKSFVGKSVVTVLAIALAFGFFVSRAEAGVPTVLSAKITGGNQITIVYSEAVTTVIADYTDLQGALSGRTVMNVAGSGTATILLTVDGVAMANDAVGTLDIGAGVISVSTSGPLVAVDNQPVTDGQTPTISSILSNATVAGTLKIGDAVTFTLTPGATEAGATVTGSYNGVVLVWSTADAGVTYTATYTVASGNTDQGSPLQISGVVITDSAGNASAPGSGSDVVKTIDANRPTLNPVGIASNNTDTSLAKNGNVVTLTFTANEIIGSPTITFTSGGNAVASTVTVLNTSGNTWTASYVVDPADTDGAVGFTANFSDVAGNAGVAVTTVTDALSVTVDKAAPVISSLSLTPNSGTANIGDVITLTINSDGTGYTAGPITLNGVATTGFTSAGGNNYSATYTVVSGNTDRAAGAVPASVVLTDSAGNLSAAFTTVDANTLALDASVPTLTFVGVASNNPNPIKAKNGDLVTLTLTANETIGSPSVTFTSGGNAVVGPVGAPINTVGNTWTVSYTVQAGDTDGAVAFNINFSDAAGNAGLAVSAVTNGSSVTVDKLAPTLTSVTIISNNTNSSSLAKVGDTVTLSFTSSETVQTPAVTIAGVASVSANVGGNNWQALHVMTGADASGTVAFTIDFSDLAGNAGSQVAAIMSGSNVIFDKTAPTVNSITTKDVNLDGRVDTATIVFSEPIKDATFVAANFTIKGSAATMIIFGTADDNTFDVEIAGGVTGTNTSTVAYTGTGTDLAGNLLASFSLTSTDGAKPIFMSARTQTTATINATFSETIDGTTVNPSGTDFTVTVPTLTVASSSKIASSTVRVRVSTSFGTGITPTLNLVGLIEDSAGLSSPTTTSIIATDGVPPVLATTTIASNNANTIYAKTGDTVTLSFTSSEAIQTPTVMIQGVAATTVTSTSPTSWTASRLMTNTDIEGNVTFTIDYADLATNAGVQVTTTSNGSNVLFDRTKPTVSAGADFSTHVPITLNGAAGDEPSGSGLASVLWSSNGAVLGTSATGTVIFSPPNNATTTISADTIGRYIVNLVATDNAGNVSLIDGIEFAWQVMGPGSVSSVIGGSSGGGGSVLGVQTGPDANANTNTQPNTQNQVAEGVQTNTQGQVQSTVSFTFARNLTLGSRGDDVIALQQRLTAEGVYSGPITGYFGPLTRRAVIAFQAKYGIAQVGNVGPLTRARLNAAGQVAGAATFDAQAAQAELNRLQNLLNQLLEQLRGR